MGRFKRLLRYDWEVLAAIVAAVAAVVLHFLHFIQVDVLLTISTVLVAALVIRLSTPERVQKLRIALQTKAKEQSDFGAVRNLVCEPLQV